MRCVASDKGGSTERPDKSAIFGFGFAIGTVCKLDERVLIDNRDMTTRRANEPVAFAVVLRSRAGFLFGNGTTRADANG